jgi:hypothetical protein
MKSAQKMCTDTSEILKNRPGNVYGHESNVEEH